MGAGRHKKGANNQLPQQYSDAGKRKLVSTSGPPATGRHRGAGRSRGRREVPVPHIVAGIAIAGLLSGSAVAGGSGSDRRSSAVTATESPVAAAVAQRRVPVSRSTSRTPGPGIVSDEVERRAADRAGALARLRREAEQQEMRREAARWVLPVDVYHLTGRFGERSSLWGSTHTGLDFATDWGAPIHAVAAGRVTEAGWAGAYGYRTIVELSDGTEIWYCHQSRIDVNPGRVVARGQTIGGVGSTGNSTGSHVHIEVRPGGGDPTDPEVAFADHGVVP